MKKLKVLIIQSRIKHYRVPVFNKIAQKVDLTVMYDKGDEPQGADFNTVKFETAQFGRFFTYHKKSVLSYAEKFDATIMMLDSSFLTTHLLAHLRRKTALIFWGIGVAASRSMRYDECQKTAKKYNKLINRADAALFYSDYPVGKYTKMGVKEEKLFVAPNTVEVLPIQKQERKNILFVGSLYKAKKIFELLECYNNAYQKDNDLPSLAIIGDGEEYLNIKEWIASHNLEEKIELAGEIFDENILADYFSKALVCISPDQAGLSVLKSFGYGVAFVTHKDAITGGERQNITSGENGILFQDFNEIESVIAECAANPQKYIQMGEKAKEHYDKSRKVEDMVQGFIDAIGYATKEKL